MGGWSTSILTFVAIDHCEANILPVSNQQVAFLFGGGVLA